MYTYSAFLLIFLGVVLVNGSPLVKEKQFAPGVDGNQDEHSEQPRIERLTDQVTPQSYELRVIPDLSTFKFSGNVKIAVLVKYATSKIKLHSKGLDIGTVTVSRGARPIALANTPVTYDVKKDQLIIETASELTYNTEYTVTIDFEGSLSDDLKGFYKSSYTIDGKEYWLAATQFEPTYAREAFPCFDEPRFRAKFTIYVARFENQNAISNMPIEDASIKDSALKDRVWTKFQQSPPMATYLVAFIVSDLESVTDDEKIVSVWARKDAKQSCSYALQQSKKLLKHLEGYTGIPHKLPKLDVVAVPDFKSGAMENWGLTTYRERFVILDESSSTESHKSVVTEVISHEFAHQWFGDLVTPAWWDYLWLNEGFATYFEYFAAHSVESTWNLDQLFVVEVTQAALWAEIKTQRAMTASITTDQAIKDIFDIISYEKAGSVIRMMEHVVTPDVFKTVLHHYLYNRGEKGTGTVVPSHLWEEFDEQAFIASLPLPPHTQLSEILNGWAENIGYPLITVTRNATSQKIKIEQTTYKSARAPKPAPDQKWIVPLTYTTKSERKFSDTRPSAWSFAGEAIELSKEMASGDWVIFNLQQSAYYRVNYDSNNWKLLIDQLNEDPNAINVLNRAQLVDDSMALARDKLGCFHKALHIMQYLPKESDWIPWYSAITHLDGLFTEYESTSLEDGVRTFIKQILQKPYDNFGFQIQSKDSHLTKVVKPLFLSLACDVGVDGCSENALEIYTKHKEDVSKIQPDLKKVVFCNVLRNSVNQQEVFSNLWSTYLKSNIANDKNVILASFSCAKDEEIIKNIFSKLIDPTSKDIRKHDKRLVLYRFLSRVSSTTAVINFLLGKTSTILELNEYALSTIKEILDSLRSSVKTESQIQLLKQLESKFQTLDQQKFGDLTKRAKSAYEQGAKTKEQIENNRAKFAPILGEFIPKPESHTTQSPKENSAPSIMVSSLWSRLLVVGIAFCYGLPMLRQVLY